MPSSVLTVFFLRRTYGTNVFAAYLKETNVGASDGNCYFWQFLTSLPSIKLFPTVPITLKVSRISILAGDELFGWEGCGHGFASPVLAS